MLIVADIVRAKRLGWDEGPDGNVTRIDILDSYDYDDDTLEGEHIVNHIGNERVGPYIQHLVDGQIADPHTIVMLKPDGGTSSTVVPPATLRASGGATVTQAVESTATDGAYADDVPMPDTGKCPDGMEPSDDGKTCVPVSPAADDDDDEDMGGKPSKGTNRDKRLKRNDKKASGTTEQLATEAAPNTQWSGVLVVEGTPTGDGREFAPDSIEWADTPLPLRWQKTDSHGGMPTNETVRVGNITRVWRDGSNIMGEGFFDLGGPEDDDAHEAYRRMGAETLTGVSIDADDITDADIEYVFPEPDDEAEEEDDIFFLLFAMPEKIIFHAARIRAATLCDIPAFVEAQIHLISDEEAAALLAGAVVVETDGVASHTTATSDGTWDAATNEGRLPRVMSVDTARGAYAWLDLNQIEGDACGREAGRFLHHEVDADGAPSAANLTACASSIGSLDARRHGDARDVYEHLARHLRDAGLEPPPFKTAGSALVAHAWHDEWRPPREWFNDPKLGQVMPIMVSEQGRVYGHAAQWGQCHLGFMSECVMPPHEEYHAYYLTGELPLDDGTRIAVGQITAGIEHAGLPLRASSAKQHYENTDAVIADVITGNDQHGIWVAGAVRPWAQTSRVAALRASGQVSPDWRRIGGALRMVALLTVNTSGYTVPRARSLVAGGEIQTLISSGMVTVKHHGPTDDELNKRALRLMQEALAKRVHGGTT